MVPGPCAPFRTATVGDVTDFQRIFVVGTQADDAAVARLRGMLGSQATVLTAPTPEARLVVEGLARDPVVEVGHQDLVAPVHHQAGDQPAQASSRSGDDSATGGVRSGPGSKVGAHGR